MAPKRKNSHVDEDKDEDEDKKQPKRSKNTGYISDNERVNEIELRERAMEKLENMINVHKTKNAQLERKIAHEEKELEQLKIALQLCETKIAEHKMKTEWNERTIDLCNAHIAALQYAVDVISIPNAELTPLPNGGFELDGGESEPLYIPAPPAPPSPSAESENDEPSSSSFDLAQ
jgi:hypothetical protein